MKRISVLACTALLLAGFASTAQAGLSLEVQTVDATPGSSGFLEVLITNTDIAEQSLTLSGFSIDLSLSGSDVLLTGVDDLTTFPYVFGSEGSGILTFDAFPNTGFLLSDFSTNPEGFVTLVAGQTYGLGRIAFSVGAAAALGLRDLVILLNDRTELVDGEGIAYSPTALTIKNGGVNVVRDGGIIPEPASFIHMLGALVTFGAIWRYRKTQFQNASRV